METWKAVEKLVIVVVMKIDGNRCLVTSIETRYCSDNRYIDVWYIVEKFAIGVVKITTVHNLVSSREIRYSSGKDNDNS